MTEQEREHPLLNFWSSGTQPAPGEQDGAIVAVDRRMGGDQPMPSDSGKTIIDE